jgi:hypothetical protein
LGPEALDSLMQCGALLPLTEFNAARSLPSPRGCPFDTFPAPETAQPSLQPVGQIHVFGLTLTLTGRTVSFWTHRCQATPPSSRRPPAAVQWAVPDFRCRGRARGTVPGPPRTGSPTRSIRLLLLRSKLYNPPDPPLSHRWRGEFSPFPACFATSTHHRIAGCCPGVGISSYPRNAGPQIIRVYKTPGR